MTQTSLSHYFERVACKRLSRVEIDPHTSNQHEFQGVAALRAMFGTERVQVQATFLYFNNEIAEPIAASAGLTWYNARAAHPERAAEYHLYYQGNAVCDAAGEGDLLIIGLRPGGEVLVIIAGAESTAENQLKVLFGLEAPGSEIAIRELATDNQSLGVARALILEQIGLEDISTDDEHLELMLGCFPAGFPPTREFSAFARQTLPDLNSLDDPDAAIVAWWEREELLFRTLERHFVSIRLERGFNSDVDAFLEYSLRVHQIRKSRAGRALENHAEQILLDHEIAFDRGKETENRARPDFLFPGTTEYRDTAFPSSRLTMLGVKTTCKDRWRQVLTEASRIRPKHLLTLEPAISVSQTEEMKSNSLQLVVPASIQSSYEPGQRRELLGLAEFISLVRSRQKPAGT